MKNLETLLNYVEIGFITLRALLVMKEMNTILFYRRKLCKTEVEEIAVEKLLFRKFIKNLFEEL